MIKFFMIGIIFVAVFIGTETLRPKCNCYTIPIYQGLKDINGKLEIIKSYTKVDCLLCRKEKIAKENQKSKEKW